MTLNTETFIFLTNLDNSNNITLEKNISGGRKTIKPILILYNIWILEKWAQENYLDDNILFATNLTKYSNDKLALYLLKNFEIHSQKI